MSSIIQITIQILTKFPSRAKALMISRLNVNTIIIRKYKATRAIRERVLNVKNIKTCPDQTCMISSKL